MTGGMRVRSGGVERVGAQSKGGTYRRLVTEVHKAEYGNRLSRSTPHHFSSVFAYGASRSHRPVSTVRGCSLRMPRGGCSALPRTVDTGVARYEAFASHNVRRAVCLSVLEQCSKVPRSELCVKWIPALSASHHTRQFCTANQ
ncbi:hypothetical protein J6590_041089 [Homalodisca vitripennis]|nr:hypothetical protein J6590_041089 [Homalodisca vitripennis]